MHTVNKEHKRSRRCKVLVLAQSTVCDLAVAMLTIAGKRYQGVNHPCGVSKISKIEQIVKFHRCREKALRNFRMDPDGKVDKLICHFLHGIGEALSFHVPIEQAGIDSLQGLVIRSAQREDHKVSQKPWVDGK